MRHQAIFFSLFCDGMLVCCLRVAARCQCLCMSAKGEMRAGEAIAVVIKAGDG